MSTELRQALWPEGYDRIVLDETDSTMAEARSRAAGLARPTWILARHQTDARGRRGRAWFSPPGNFAATLVLPSDGPPARMALRSFVASLALLDALMYWVDGARCALKWPNDVLVDGAKIAGILLEAGGGGPDWLSIGFGVNLAHAPDAGVLEQGAVAPVHLAELTDEPPSPETFLDYLAAMFEMEDASFRRHGFRPIQGLWLARAAKLGEDIRVRLPREEFSGVFDTVDDDGCLVLTTPDGLRRISAGEVFLT
ncbi:MAG: biotin--[acetyl-CoA-carboxylase] ligase [Pseudomonadota bacterium]